jgi:hypothetical protein
MATRLTKTNPAYAHLAHTRAILSYTIALLQERYLGLESQDPQDVMYSEDLPRDDAAVPEDAILLFIRDLQHTRLEVERQMQRFDFVPQGDVNPRVSLSGALNPTKGADGHTEPQAAKGHSVKRKKGKQSAT